MSEPTDLRFLSFFLREPIYVVEEPHVPSVERTLPEEEPPNNEPSLSTVATDVEALSTTAPGAAAPDQIPHQGQGHQQVLIMVCESDSEYLNATDQALLEKILSAVSLSLNDVVLTNAACKKDSSPESLAAPWLQAFNCTTLLVFGDQQKRWLSEDYEVYTLQHLPSGQKVLYADALSVIAADLNKKGQLWKGLQMLFAAHG